MTAKCAIKPGHLRPSQPMAGESIVTGREYHLRKRLREESQGIPQLQIAPAEWRVLSL